MRRRAIISMLGYAGLGALASPLRLYAASERSPRLLLVFLRGGYDCNSVLVPYNSDFYYESRPTIAIPRPNSGDKNAAIKLDGDWALSPAVAEALWPLWNKKQIAFLPFAGTDNLSRSHFETQDDIEAGFPAAQRQIDYNSGFLGRLAEELTDARPIAFTPSLPLIFQGGPDVPNISFSGQLQRGRLDNRQFNLLAEMYKGHPQQKAIEEGYELRKQAVEDLMAEEIEASGQGAPKPEAFERQARRMAKMMKDQYRLGFADVGGWDTHIDQGAATGQLAVRLTRLCRGLTAYADELGESEWAMTTVVVISEFGRTFRQNGSRGTDHGHGTVYWTLGGDLDGGGKIVGKQVHVKRENLQDYRDYKVLNNYRDYLGSVFRSLWNLDAKRLDNIFP